jgi:hypothetical protein
MKEQDILREELLAAVQQFDSENQEIKKEETKEEAEAETKEEAEIEVEAETSDNIDEEKDQEEPKDKAEDEKKEFDDKGDLHKKLSGQPKEFIDAVKSIKDPEAQAQVIEAGKFLRAREDQVRLELGNTKKEMANLKAFDESFKKDPIQTLKDLAKFANVDLNSLIETVQDDYDYRSPEELAKDNHYKNIESRLNQIENQKKQEQSNLNAREIEQFKSEKDSNGDIKFPHFERVRLNMSTFYIEGHPLFNPDLTLEQVYKKAVMLDDELVELRDADISRKAELKRKKELEKAKGLRKFSGTTSSVNVRPANEKAELLELVKASGITW